MSSLTSGIFTGSSQFSADFQQAIQRAVQFASLPLQQTQNDVSALTAQSSELATLSSKFTSLQGAISNLNSALGKGSYAAAASAPASGAAVASVALSGTPGVGAYSLEVVSTGSFASAMSNAGSQVKDPAVASISTASLYTLTVGDVATAISPANGSLLSLTEAINGSGAGVTATVVNVGPGGAPDYRLSIQNTRLANTGIQLTGDTGAPDEQPLLTRQADGSAATYRVNGEPASPGVLTSDSAVITLAPGVSATLLAPGRTTVTVSQNTGAVSSALAALTAAYNAAESEIAANRGEGKGVLQGQSILLNLDAALKQIAHYATGGSGISSLASLGVSVDSKGVMSFDAGVFANATSGRIGQLATFLGSTASGGFLKMAGDVLAGANDPASGMLQSGIQSIQKGIARDNAAISTQQDRLTTLTNSLNRQMAAADAAIASLEQQYSYLASMFQQMRVNSQNGG